jgi:hypothetical protein
MTVAALPPPEVLARDPSWFPFLLDPAHDQLLLVRKTEAHYRAASFLDKRSVSARDARALVPWKQVASAVDPAARRDAQYIFHIGHSGSTLVSRLLGALDGVLGLREPLLLRTFTEVFGAEDWAEAEMAARCDALIALLSRTFRAKQRTLVKAASVTSEIADWLVPAGSRTLFLWVRPRVYMETILSSDASRHELAVLTPSRIARLACHCPGLSLDLAQMNEAQKAGLAWTCEMTSLARAAGAIGADRALWIDFDEFLAGPAALLSSAAHFLGHDLAGNEAEALCSGPLMRRYSKAPEYEYSPDLRRGLLSDAERRFRHDIEDALASLEAMGERWPAVAAVLHRAKEGMELP